jgi:hypothetical protein
MKFFYLSIYILLEQFASAQTPADCTTSQILGIDAQDFAESLQIPNCGNRSFFELQNNSTVLCNCKQDLERAVRRYPGLTLPTPAPIINAKQVLLNEFKKSISANLLDVTNLRSVYAVQGDFSAATRACNIERIGRLPCMAGAEFTNLQNELANELSEVLNPTPKFDNDGILQRGSSTSQCTDISDQNILRATSLNLELEIANDSGNPTIIERFSSLNPVTLAGLRNLTDSYESTVPYLTLFKNHPLFSRLISNPQEFKNFFTSLRRPVTASDLRTNLYSNTSNNQRLIQNLANNCERTISTFANKICNEAVSRNNFRISNLSVPNPYTSMAAPKPGRYVQTDPADAASQKINELSDMLKFCNNSPPTSGAIDLNETIQQISGWLPETEARASLQKYGQTRYINQFGAARTAICSARNSGNCRTSSTTYDCRLFNAYTQVTSQNTPENLLAITSDPVLNNILRTLIGNPSAQDLSPATAQILISQGIIPREDGTMDPEALAATQTDRSPRAIATPILSRSNAPTLVAPAVRRTGGSASGSARGGRTSDQSDLNPVDYDASQRAISPEVAALPEASQNKLEGIQDEIMRRITGQPRPGGRPLSADQVRRIVREESQGQQVPLSPVEENAAVAQAQLDQAGMLPSLGNARTAGLGGQVDGQVSRSAAQKVADQRAAALGGMASGGSGGGASGTAAGGSADNGRGVAGEAATLALDVTSGSATLEQILNAQFGSNGARATELQSLLTRQSSFSFRFRDRTIQVNFDRAVRRFVVATQGVSIEQKNQIEAFLNNRERARLEALSQTMRPAGT